MDLSPRAPFRAAVAGAAAATALAGCGSSAPHESGGIPRALLSQARPIGRGPRFHPPAGGGRIVGACRRALGARAAAHVELFAANRVVIVAAGIGVRAPTIDDTGRVSRARCYGALVTLDPTGIVLVRPGAGLRVADLFRAWGQRLSDHRLASFGAAPGGRVSAYVDGRSWHGAAGVVPLTRHAEIVLEIGPHVPPHRVFRFPRGE